MERKHHLLSMERKILKTLENKGGFQSLADAVDLSGLEEELNGSGPFTLFAPTDEAFANLPAGLMDTLMMDKARMAEVIKHHVIADQISSSDAISAKNAMALDGEVLDLETCNGFKVGNASVTEADIECRNGLVHVIDAVLMPKDVKGDLIDTDVPQGGDVKMVPKGGMMDKAMSTSSQKMQGMKDKMKDMGDKTMSAGSSKMNDMKDKMQNAVSNTSSATSSKMDNMKDKVHESMGDEKSSASDTKDNVRGSMDQKNMSSESPKMGEMKEEIRKKTDDKN
ncbi:hypothetical protein A3206_02895 [Candidatus Methanomassiliicoccus intestinalis]|nr:MAG: hypothetical protein A3206_02895 [Candidatus Methanomassiliicoccus intestinalis]